MDRSTSGPVTMLFSDIESSTLLLTRLGERYVQVLDQHRAVLRSAWNRWGGQEMGTEGDSFFVVFATSSDAVCAALEAQQGMREQSWPDGEVVRVRMGLHTGAPRLHGDGYVGMDVHRAARVAGTAYGGQILITEAVYTAAGHTTLDGGNVVDLGWHRLKDLPRAEHLFQLSPVPESFPPLRSRGTTASLPIEGSPLVAREEELDELRGLLHGAGARLITLTGPGGTGKTRLAVGLAAREGPSFRDGVYFVSLAESRTVSAMWISLANVLGAGAEAGDGRRVLEFLGSRQLLVVLDNLEQLAEAPRVVAAMLQASPELVVVATSRRILHLRSEFEYAVLPLALPASADPSVAELCGAVRLFVQVATMANPRFQLEESNLWDVVEICRRLDGIPLAIELAASRSRLLSPASLLSGLDRAMGLSSQDADRPVRHHTMRNAIEWSFDLLPENLRTFFCRLGVFADGCTLAAAAAVTGAADDAFESAAALVDFSLASMEDGPDGEPRVHMLRTISEFAVERLGSRGELEELHRRHAGYYLELAREVAVDISTDRQFAASARILAEDANFRVALERCLAPGSDPPGEEAARTGLELVAMLSLFWLLREPDQARQLLERALAVDPGPESVARVAALVGLAAVMDEHSEAPRELLIQALDLAEGLADPAWTAEVMTDLATLELRQGNASQAKTILEEASALAESAHDGVRLALAVHVHGEAELKLGDPERAITLFERSRELGRNRGDEAWAVWEEHWVAIANLEAGRIQEAAERLSDIVARVLEFSDTFLGKRAAKMHGGFRRADGQ